MDEQDPGLNWEGPGIPQVPGRPGGSTGLTGGLGGGGAQALGLLSVIEARRLGLRTKAGMATDVSSRALPPTTLGV